MQIMFCIHFPPVYKISWHTFWNHPLQNIIIWRPVRIYKLKISGLILENLEMKWFELQTMTNTFF